MRGEVLHYDETQGFGFLQGQDGSRYAFRREDLRGQAGVGKGAAVEFEPQGGSAVSVFPILAAGPVATSQAPWAPAEGPRSPAPSFGRQAANVPPRVTGRTGLWDYFWRALTANYANFRDRARRKEYWGYMLFWTLGFVALCGAGVVIDGSTGRFGGTGDGPIVTMVLGGLFVVGTFIPGLAMVVRRQHDIGLSGWFYLLIFIPYVGSLIIFVFTLIPSQKHANKWGPVPEGISIPPPYAPPAPG